MDRVERVERWTIANLPRMVFLLLIGALVVGLLLVFVILRSYTVHGDFTADLAESTIEGCERNNATRVVIHETLLDAISSAEDRAVAATTQAQRVAALAAVKRYRARVDQLRGTTGIIVDCTVEYPDPEEE